MFRRRASIKIISLFVVAFICLNAGGAMCVAYCQSIEIVAESEHCPLAKKDAEHCDRQSSAQPEPTAGVGDAFDCCPMTVSFFGAPIEKNTFSVEVHSNIPLLTVDLNSPAFVGQKNFRYKLDYRGPPPDGGMTRLKNCIIRI